MGIPHTRASASEVDGLGCSSGYGAQPVGLSWLPGGTLNAAPATDGHLVLLKSRECQVWSWKNFNKCLMKSNFV